MRKRITIYDAATMLYIVALYIFENSTFATLFSIIQMLFFIATFSELFRKRHFRVSLYHKWILLFAVITFVLCMLSNLPENWSTLRVILKNIFSCLCISIYVSNHNTEKVIAFFAIGGIAAGGFLLSDFASNSIVVMSLKYAGELRTGASIAGANVNVIALYMCFSFSAILYFCKNEKYRKWRMLAYLAMLFLAGTALLTGTRKLLLFYIVAITLYNLHSKRKKVILTVAVVAVLYYLVMNVEILYNLVGYKLNFFGNQSADYSYYETADKQRQSIIEQAMRLFVEWPFGIGFGTTNSKLGLYSHSNFIEVLASMGIVGAIQFYYIYAWIIVNYWKLKDCAIAQFFIVTIISLLSIEFFQVTYIYIVPMIFICIAVVSYNSLEYEHGIEMSSEEERCHSN